MSKKRKTPFNYISIPLPLMYNVTQGAVNKPEFLTTVLFYNLMITRKQMKGDTFPPITIYKLTKACKLPKGKTFKDLRNFYEKEDYAHINVDGLIVPNRESLKNFCQTIKKFPVRIKDEQYKQHQKLFSKKSFIKASPYFFSILADKNINGANLRVLLLVMRRTLDTHATCKFTLKYFQEFTGTRAVRILAALNALKRMGLIIISNYENFVEGKEVEIDIAGEFDIADEERLKTELDTVMNQLL